MGWLRIAAVQREMPQSPLRRERTREFIFKRHSFCQRSRDDCKINFSVCGLFSCLFKSVRFPRSPQQKQNREQIAHGPNETEPQPPLWRRGVAPTKNTLIRIDIDAQRHRAVDWSDWLDRLLCDNNNLFFLELPPAVDLVSDKRLAVGVDVDFATLIVTDEPVNFARQILCMNKSTNFHCVFSCDAKRRGILFGSAAGNQKRSRAAKK
jgi:hypothetical protein